MNYEEQIEKTIINGTSYTGNKDSNKKIISASTLMDDDLQLFLKYKYGYDEQEKIELNTLGTLVHNGLENIFEKIDGMEVEKRLNYEFNGWTVSAAIDLTDYNSKSITDWKMVNEDKVIKGIKKDGNLYPYSVQLAVGKWLLEKVEGIFIDKTYIGLFDKTQSYFKTDENTQRTLFHMIEMETLSHDELESIIIDKTNRLNEYIETDIYPEQCANLFWSRAYGKAKPIRCIRYCSVSSNCPYHSRYSAGSKNNLLASLVGL